MNRYVIYLLILLFSFNVPGYASNDPEHIIWEKAPIKISLPVGRERRIDFPVSVEIELTEIANQNSKTLQIREDGSIYWTAKSTFDQQRIVVFTKTGYTYLMDVEARNNAPTHPIVIIDERIEKNNSLKAEIAQRKKQYDYDYVDLARFAAKNVYAPLRLITPLPGVIRIGVQKKNYPLQRGGDLMTMPMAQWKSPTIPSFYVTAIKVTSNALDEVVFDPREIRGEWLAAASQHAVINPAGTDGDTTTWYLISTHPFEEAAP